MLEAAVLESCMKRYLTAILLSLVFLGPLGLCGYYRCYTEPRVGLLTIWLVFTFGLSVPCHVVADLWRRWMRWPVWTVFGVVPVLAYLVYLVGLPGGVGERRSSSVFGSYGPAGRESLRFWMIWAATLPMSAVVSCASVAGIEIGRGLGGRLGRWGARYGAIGLVSGVFWIEVVLFEGWAWMADSSGNGTGVYAMLAYVVAAGSVSRGWMRVLASMGMLLGRSLAYSLLFMAAVDFIRRRRGWRATAFLWLGPVASMVLSYLWLAVATGGALAFSREAVVAAAMQGLYTFPLSLSMVVAYWLMPPVKAKASEGGE